MSVLKHLKTLQHVSIFSDRLQGARRFLVKVTEFKIFTTVKVICDDAAASPQITPQWCRWIFQWHISFRPYHGPGVDPALSENEYQEHFLGVKAIGAWGWRPHHLHVPNVMEIWEPKPPGTVWTTPGLLRDTFTFTWQLVLYKTLLIVHNTF